MERENSYIDNKWLVGSHIVALFALIVVSEFARSSRALEIASQPAQPAIRGRVVDETGNPMAGARVRLYRRNGIWERQNLVIEEANADLNGRFTLKSRPTPLSMEDSRGLPSDILLADHPEKAIGWRIIPRNATSFESDITLTSPVERTITVVDVDKKPVQGAKVTACALGDPASAIPAFRDALQLQPEDGPLTAITGTDGRATLSQLPKTSASFLARKAGSAESYAFREQSVIRLTPSANLSGTVTDPEGKPLAGVRVVLFTGFMWDFERTLTDAKGRYQFKDLKARGWDMGAWDSGKEADGKYKLWLDNDRFVMPTKTLTLEPNTNEILNINAIKAGIIRVTLLEKETNKPVPNARIWGSDGETGSSGRFNAYTDDQGRATFYSAPTKIWLALVGPPEGVYLEVDRNNGDASKSIDFAGGEEELTLIMPPIAGKLITVPGICTHLDGSPAKDANVYARAGRFVASGVSSHIRNRQVDKDGQFTLEGVPSGRVLHLYAETADRKFAGISRFIPPEKDDPDFRINIPLRPTIVVESVLKDAAGMPLISKKFQVSPKSADQDFPFNRRDVQSDAKGRVKFEGIVHGLSYLVQEVVPTREERPQMIGANEVSPLFEQVLILAPQEKR